jgi:hypothetical protein
MNDVSMYRQRLRKALIIFSFVLMPITFVYISCPIITQGASEGIITGGLIVFSSSSSSARYFLGGSGAAGSVLRVACRKFIFRLMISRPITCG